MADSVVISAATAPIVGETQQSMFQNLRKLIKKGQHGKVVEACNKSKFTYIKTILDYVECTEMVVYLYCFYVSFPNPNFQFAF